MALADPQVITVNTVAKSMPLITRDGTKSTYSNNDSTFTLTISHKLTGDRVRTMARFDQKAIVPDPLTSVNDWETLSFYCVVERPVVGFTSVQLEQQIAGFKTWLDNTMIGKLFGQES